MRLMFASVCVICKVKIFVENTWNTCCLSVFSGMIHILRICCSGFPFESFCYTTLNRLTNLSHAIKLDGLTCISIKHSNHTVYESHIKRLR